MRSLTWPRKALIIENAILRQLNAELMDKKLLLKERLDSQKSEEIKAPSKTFAEITTNSKPINTRVPKLMVKKPFCLLLKELSFKRRQKQH